MIPLCIPDAGPKFLESESTVSFKTIIGEFDSGKSLWWQKRSLLRFCFFFLHGKVIKASKPTVSRITDLDLKKESVVDKVAP